MYGLTLKPSIDDNTLTISFTKRPHGMSSFDFKDFNSKHSDILNHTFDSYDVRYLGERNSDDWERDSFLVSINGIDFSYSAGFGLRTEKQGIVLVHAPIIDDVLFSLVMDASYGSETFGDFCANLGYYGDSKKALEIYLECQKTYDKNERTFAFIIGLG